MARIKDLNSALPSENDAFAFDGANGTKRISYAEFKQKLIDDGFGSGSSEAVVLTQAEYNALPDDVKDSDTIFFISDAPFENSNVVPLTLAEYNALSDATKNDGRFYYVTDEEEVAKSLVVQTNQNNTETVPSSAVVYSGLNALSDSLSNTVLRKNASGNGSFTFTMNAALAVVFIKRNDTNATNYSVYLLFYHQVTGFVVCPIHEDSDTTYTFTNNGQTVTAKSNATTYTFVQIIN